MATFLFDKIIFGPVYSRRLGVSLGINLLPFDRKVCNFNCIYCECGITEPGNPDNSTAMPSREQVKNALYQTLEDMAASDQDPEVITFAGNGEPTLHPDFEGIVDDTIEVRDIFFPGAGIAVLSNATNIHLDSVRKALGKTDKCILKLDSALDETIRLHNRPISAFDVNLLIDNLAQLNIEIIIQTMFIQGSYNETIIDNTTDREIAAWLEALKKIRPAMVQIYTISRDTPGNFDIRKVPAEVLLGIAERVEALGIKTQVSA